MARDVSALLDQIQAVLAKARAQAKKRNYGVSIGYLKMGQSGLHTIVRAMEEGWINYNPELEERIPLLMEETENLVLQLEAQRGPLGLI